jgi:hypothetical protein
VEADWAATVGRDDLEHLRATLTRLLERDDREPGHDE